MLALLKYWLVVNLALILFASTSYQHPLRYVRSTTITAVLTFGVKERVLIDSYIEHSPESTDGLGALESTLNACSEDDKVIINYTKNHRVLAQGNFVLSVSEGHLAGVHTAFYDFYRLVDGKHWDTREAVPPLSEWENDNGKF